MVGLDLMALTEARRIFFFPQWQHPGSSSLTQTNREVPSTASFEKHGFHFHIFTRPQLPQSSPYRHPQISLNTFREIQSGWKEMNSLFF